MTAGEDDPLIDVAGALADGQTIDWGAIESEAASPAARDRVRRLESIARIARLHAGAMPSPASLHDSLLHPTPTTSVETDPAPPVTWGPLTVIEKVGQGTFGDVYRARESRLDREVALKLLRHRDDGLAQTPDVIEEARVLAKVCHPNVMTIYGADRIDGRVGFWMEFIQGQTLEAELRTRGPFPIAELQRVGREIAAALGAVHRAGLLHRDVKAHNVMRARDGRLLLTDFGTGRPVGTSAVGLGERLTGTPLYLAPEVLAGDSATIQSDLYGLGVLLYRLATGVFPVSAASLSELRSAHEARVLTPLRRRRPDLPAPFSDTVDRALSARPSDRPATADDFATALNPIVKKSGRRLALIGASLLLATGLVWIGLASRTGGTAELQPDAEALVLAGRSAPGVLAVSRDGRYLAYSDGATGNLGVFNLGTGVSRLVTASASWDTYNVVDSAVFSRDGHTLAYTWTALDRGSSRLSIRLIDVDRPKEAAPIFTGDLDNWTWIYDWSADGRDLAVAVARRGVTDLALLPLSGGAPVVLQTLDWRGTSAMVFSPDGRFLAYDHAADASAAQRDVAVIAIGDRESRRSVTGPGDDRVVGWSPDGTHVLFASDRSASMNLWAQPVAEGISTGGPFLLRSGIQNDVVGASEDGRVFYRAVSRDQITVVAPIDLRTGEATGLVSTRFMVGLYREGKPKWSPDARWLAHMSATPYANGRQEHVILSIQSTTSDQARILPLKLQTYWTYSWSPDGRSILVRARDFQKQDGIFRIDVTSGEVVPVLVGQELMVWHPHWTRDGRRFFYVKGSPAGSPDDVVLERNIELGTDRVVIRRRDLRTENATLLPALRDWVVSPDGALVAGLEATKTSHTVWVANVATRIARQVYRVDRVAACCGNPITHNALLWTPDSRALIVNAGVSAEPRRRGLCIVPVAEGELPQQIDVGPSLVRDDAPTLSSDGRQIAFLSGMDPHYEIRALRYKLPSR